MLTSCTNVKLAHGGMRLRQEDFAAGPERLRALHDSMSRDLVPAERLYRGQQHIRLMRGVHAARTAGHEVSVAIVSAGYGLLGGEDLVASYDCTFQGMSSHDRQAWAEHLALPPAVTSALGDPVDLNIVLLGDDYFRACVPTGRLPTVSTTVVLCGAQTALRLVPAENVRPVVLSESDTRRFGCGLVGLKGEVAGRLIIRLARDPSDLQVLESESLLDELSNVSTSGQLAVGS